MATQASGVAAGDASGVIEQLQRLIERFGLIAAGLVALASSVAALWKEDSQPELRWGVIGLAVAALMFIVVGKVVVPAIQARRRQKVIAIPEASLRGPMTFRLRPYDEADHAGFDRPDRAHDAALRWLQKSSATFLYLTGFSGTGKSSLLQAWLIPELAQGDPPTRTVVARSYADPLGQLTEALTKPGVLWDRRAPATEDPYALLERAAEKVRPARLLIAIDQFEECLILQSEAGREQLAALFRSIAERPIPGLAFLLVLRTDYLDVDQLRGLGLPEVRSDANWFNLNALSRGEARELLDQRLKLHEREREKVLDEASEVDDLPGLVRPITLNMLGLVLQRARGGVLAGTAPGRLIQNYLRSAMAQPGIDDLAPRLLEPMITDQGTKRPADEPKLVEATGAEPRLVRKALLLLAEEGVVRELEPERHVWEISHDFVARQLGQIIPRLRPSRLRRLQTMLAPVALLAWLALLPVLALAGPELMERYARNALADEGVQIPWSKELGGYEVDFGTAKSPGAFDRLHGLLRWLRPIRSVRIANDSELTDLAPLYDVIEPGELTQLMISGNDGLQALPAWDGLGALTRLTIYGNSGLQALPAWDGLGALTQLDISGNAGLQALPAWDGLGALTLLIIYGNAGLQTLPAWEGLGALTQLWISGNDSLQAVPAWDGLGALTQLEISNNAGLQALPAWDGRGALTALEISNNAGLQALPAWDGLGALTQLEISGNAGLQALPAWDGLGALTQLTISFNNAGLQALPAWDGLGALTQLTVERNAGLQALPDWDGLGALTQLTISGNAGLQALPAWDGLGALTQLRISANDALHTIDGLAGLKSVEELRLHGEFLPTALAGIATLPRLRRLMLPIDMQGTELDRTKELPPVEVRFIEPGSGEWWGEWKPGES